MTKQTLIGRRSRTGATCKTPRGMAVRRIAPPDPPTTADARAPVPEKAPDTPVPAPRTRNAAVRAAGPHGRNVAPGPGFAEGREFSRRAPLHRRPGRGSPSDRISQPLA